MDVLAAHHYPVKWAGALHHEINSQATAEKRHEERD